MLNTATEEDSGAVIHLGGSVTIGGQGLRREATLGGSNDAYLGALAPQCLPSVNPIVTDGSYSEERPCSTRNVPPGVNDSILQVYSYSPHTQRLVCERNPFEGRL